VNRLAAKHENNSPATFSDCGANFVPPDRSLIDGELQNRLLYRSANSHSIPEFAGVNNISGTKRGRGHRLKRAFHDRCTRRISLVGRLRLLFMQGHEKKNALEPPVEQPHEKKDTLLVAQSHEEEIDSRGGLGYRRRSSTALLSPKNLLPTAETAQGRVGLPIFQMRQLPSKCLTKRGASPSNRG
jgi:hypothetical protein